MPGRWAEVEEHLASCSCCARYDRVMNRGLELLSDLPVRRKLRRFHAAAETSSLQRRLWRERGTAQLRRKRGAGRCGGCRPARPVLAPVRGHRSARDGASGGVGPVSSARSLRAAVALPQRSVRDYPPRRRRIVPGRISHGVRVAASSASKFRRSHRSFLPQVGARPLQPLSSRMPLTLGTSRRGIT